MIIGQYTFISSWLFCAAISMVLSFPITCMHIISIHSGIEGLTFPGMIDDPGCTGGSVISPIPAFGPMFMSFRSPQKFSRFTDNDLNVAEKFKKLFMLFVVSVMFAVGLKFIFVIFDKVFIIIILYFGCVFIPVPIAVPPIPKIFKSLLCRSMNFLDFLIASLYESNSCPSVIGTASCK